jgi:hypothetical protein
MRWNEEIRLSLLRQSLQPTDQLQTTHACQSRCSNLRKYKNYTKQTKKKTYKKTQIYSESRIAKNETKLYQPKLIYVILRGEQININLNAFYFQN